MEIGREMDVKFYSLPIEYLLSTFLYPHVPNVCGNSSMQVFSSQISKFEPSKMTKI